MFSRAEPIIIAVVGLAGSGKSEATKRFIERGFVRIGFNDPVYEELERLGLERNEKNERMVRENLRKDLGMAATAIRALPRVEKALDEGKNVVVESLYSWSEYKLMKEKFGDQFRVLAIYAPQELRYTRLAVRPERPISEEAARSRDYSEIENIEKAGPIAMADWTVKNTQTLEEFHREVDALVDETQGN